jgi:hypothetical protein
LEKDVKYVSIILEPPFEDDTLNGGIKTPEGSIINPEIRLIDVDGKEYELRFAGSRHFQNNKYVNYKYDGKLPNSKDFSKILIKRVCVKSCGNRFLAFLVFHLFDFQIFNSLLPAISLL